MITQTQLGLLHTITFTLKNKCRLRTKLRKRDDFNDIGVTCVLMCSNIPGGPAYGVYISQWIRYFRDWDFYHDFFVRGLQLTRKLLIQGFIWIELKSSFQTFYYRHHNVSTIPSFPHSWLDTVFVTTSATIWCRNQLILWSCEFITGLRGVRVAQL